VTSATASFVGVRLEIACSQNPLKREGEIGRGGDTGVLRAIEVWVAPGSLRDRLWLGGEQFVPSGPLGAGTGAPRSRSHLSNRRPSDKFRLCPGYCRRDPRDEAHPPVVVAPGADIEPVTGSIVPVIPRFVLFLFASQL